MVVFVAPPKEHDGWYDVDITELSKVKCRLHHKQEPCCRCTDDLAKDDLEKYKERVNIVQHQCLGLKQRVEAQRKIKVSTSDHHVKAEKKALKEKLLREIETILNEKLPHSTHDLQRMKSSSSREHFRKRMQPAAGVFDDSGAVRQELWHQDPKSPKKGLRDILGSDESQSARRRMSKCCRKQVLDAQSDAKAAKSDSKAHHSTHRHHHHHHHHRHHSRGHHSHSSHRPDSKQLDLHCRVAHLEHDVKGRTRQRKFWWE